MSVDSGRFLPSVVLVLGPFDSPAPSSDLKKHGQPSTGTVNGYKPGTPVEKAVMGTSPSSRVEGVESNPVGPQSRHFGCQGAVV